MQQIRYNAENQLKYTKKAQFSNESEIINSKQADQFLLYTTQRTAFSRLNTYASIMNIFHENTGYPTA